MTKPVALLALCWLLCFLTTSKAQAQWEDAQVQRLTYDSLPNEAIRLYVDEEDKLHLFYLEGVKDSATGFVYDYTIMYRTKEQGSAWSEPEEIRTPEYVFGQNRKGGLWLDTNTGIVHILYPSLAGDLYDDTLYYTNSTVPDWEFTKIDSMPGQQWHADYHSFDMGFDDFGNVHIAWHMDFDSITFDWYRVIYTNNSSGGWAKREVSPPIWLGGFGSGPTEMSVQGNGAAHIVYPGEPYCGLDCNSFYVRNDSLNSIDWVTDTVPKPSRPLWHYGAGKIEVDVNDTVHLECIGCISEDCVWQGQGRTFYYRRALEDTLWTGPEVVPDSLFNVGGMFIDHQSVAHFLEFDSYCWYFTSREGGTWREPYQILDDTYWISPLLFVLDSKGKGHGVFSGCLFPYMAQDDSMEAFYFGASGSSVEQSSEEQAKPPFRLVGNYPNPFNQSTTIVYTLSLPRPMPVSLIIYNILGDEVRVLVNSVQKPGRYQVSWDGNNNSGKEVASGVYFCKLRVSEGEEVRKMLLIK